MEPVGECLGQKITDVDDLGSMALDHSVTEHARPFTRHFNVKSIFHDIDNLVDDEAHGAAAVGEDQDRLPALLFEAGLHIDAQERHELIAVLDEMTTLGNLNLAAVYLLKARDQRQGHSLRLVRAGAEHKHRYDVVGPRLLAVVAIRTVVASRLRDPPQRLRDSFRVDDHNHRAIAENGGTREHPDVTELGGHRLDDDLLGMEYAVDDDAKNLAADLGDHNKAFLPVAVAQLQHVLEVEQRKELVP